MQTSLPTLDDVITHEYPENFVMIVPCLPIFVLFVVSVATTFSPASSAADRDCTTPTLSVKSPQEAAILTSSDVGLDFDVECLSLPGQGFVKLWDPMQDTIPEGYTFDKPIASTLFNLENGNEACLQLS